MAEYRQKLRSSPRSASKLEVYEEKCTPSPYTSMPHSYNVQNDRFCPTRDIVQLYRWGIEVGGLGCHFSSYTSSFDAERGLRVSFWRDSSIYARNRHWSTKNRISINKKIRWANRRGVPVTQRHYLMVRVLCLRACIYRPFFCKNALQRHISWMMLLIG